jgi:iron complex transport system ATP-binding protein
MRQARHLSDRGAAVLVVMHDLSLASRYADRIVLMRNGSVMADGTVASVMRQELLEATYDVPFAVVPDLDGTLLVLPRPARA